MKIFAKWNIFVVFIVVMAFLQLGKTQELINVKKLDETISKISLLCLYGYYPGTDICKCPPRYIRNSYGKCVKIILPPIPIPFPFPPIPIPQPDPIIDITTLDVIPNIANIAKIVNLKNIAQP